MEVPLYAAPSALCGLPAAVRTAVARPLAAHCASCSEDELRVLLLGTQQQQPAASAAPGDGCRSAAALLDVLGAGLLWPCEPGRAMLQLVSQTVTALRRVFVFFRDLDAAAAPASGPARPRPWGNALFTDDAAARHELFARVALETCAAIACIVHAEQIDSDLNARALELLCDVLVVMPATPATATASTAEPGARLPALHTSKVLRRLASIVSGELAQRGGGGPSRAADRTQAFSVLLYCLAACGPAADTHCWRHCVRIVRGADSEVSNSMDISKSKNLELVACWHRASSCFARALVDAGDSSSRRASNRPATLEMSPSRGNATLAPDAPLLFVNWVETGRETAPHLGLQWLARSFALVLSCFAPATVHPASAIPVAAVYADIAGTLRTAPNLDAATALKWLGMPVITACGTTPELAAPSPSLGVPPPTATTASFDLLITSLETITIIGARFVASEHPETISAWKALTAQTIGVLLSASPSPAPAQALELPSARLDDATRFLRNFHDVAGRCRNHLTWAHIYRHAILKVIPPILALLPHHQQQQQQQQPGAPRASISAGGGNRPVVISEKTWASIAHHLSVAATSDFLWESWAVVSRLQDHVRINILALEPQRAAVVASVATLVMHARTSHERPAAVATVMCNFAAAVLGALKDRLVPHMVSNAAVGGGGGGADPSSPSASSLVESQLRGVLSLLQCVALFPWSFVAAETSSANHRSGDGSGEDFAAKLEPSSADFVRLLAALGALVDTIVSHLHEREMLGRPNDDAAGASATAAAADGAGPQSLLLAAYYWLVRLLSRVAGLLPPSCRARGFEVAARAATQGLSMPLTKEAYFVRAAAADLFFQATVTFAAARLPDSVADEAALRDRAERISVFAIGAERIVSLIQLRNGDGELALRRDAAADRTCIVALIRSPAGRSAFLFRRVPPAWPAVPTTAGARATATAAAAADDRAPPLKSLPRADPLATASTSVSAAAAPSAADAAADDLADVLFARKVNIDAGGSVGAAPMSGRDRGGAQPVEDSYPLLRHLAREFTLQTTNWKLLAFTPGLVAQLRGLDRAADELPELVVPIETARAWWSPPPDQRIDVARRQQRFEAFLAALGHVTRATPPRSQGDDGSAVGPTTVCEFRCTKRGAVVRFVLTPAGSTATAEAARAFPIVLRFGEPDALPTAATVVAVAPVTQSVPTAAVAPRASMTASPALSVQQQQQMARAGSLKGKQPSSSSQQQLPHFSSSFSATPTPIRIGVTPVEGCGLFALKLAGTVTRNVGRTGAAMELEACATLIRDVCMLHYAEHIQPHLLVARREALRRVIATADPFRDGAPLEASPANVVCELMHQNELQL